MMYVVFMKNFYLIDSNEVMAVRHISASWAQKQFDSYRLDMVYAKRMKNPNPKTFDSYLVEIV